MSKQLVPFLKSHPNSLEAYERTTERNVIAVVVRTYTNVAYKLADKRYYSYKTKWPYDKPDGEMMLLKDDFPLYLGTNQSIEEIDSAMADGDWINHDTAMYAAHLAAVGGH